MSRQRTQIDVHFLLKKTKKIKIKKIYVKKFMNKVNRKKIRKITKKVISITLSLLILLIGLDLIKHSLITWFDKNFFANFFVSPTKSFFISYLMTEITMSWSPIAWAFISLGESLKISAQNLAAILMWTRWWVNSFLLITGILMLFKWKSLRRALWITVIQFLVTLSVTLLSAIFMFPLLKTNILGLIANKITNWLVVHSAIDVFTGFFSAGIKLYVWNKVMLIIIGIFMLIWWLFLFDKSFSFLGDKKNKEKLKKIENKKTAFVSWFIITALTMSLSISITILLPLYTRKLFNRKLLIAYILWANISTLFDTLFLWVITKSRLGIEVIIAFLISVILAVSIYLIFYKYYFKTIWKITDIILKNKYRFLIFTIIVMLVPVLFLL